MTLLARQVPRLFRVCSSFVWPDFRAGAVLSRARFALPRACCQSASLDSAFFARAILTAMQMKNFARLTKYNEAVRLK